MQRMMYTPITYLRVRTDAATRTPPFAVWLGIVQIVLAYEWLVSGLNKLTNPTFGAHLTAMLQASIQGSPFPWYVSLLRHVVMPNDGPCAGLVAWGETAIGATLLLGAALWFIAPLEKVTRAVSRIACLALVAAMFININYYLLGGADLPWIDPSHAYGDGVRLDALLPMISLALIGANLSALRAQGKP